MPLTPDEEYLAEHCYGFGSWSGCYWFVGPEQGMGKELVAERARAFRSTDRDNDGLSDCRQFHLELGDNRWHEPPVKPQKTWNYQISLLNGYLGQQNDSTARRQYQSEELGIAKGETCILELRGLSSKSSKDSKDQSGYIPRREKRLKKMIEVHRPVFVVFYGTADLAHWELIAGCRLELDQVTSHQGTLFAFLRHPNARKDLARPHAHWIKVGEKIHAERLLSGFPDRCIESIVPAG